MRESDFILLGFMVTRYVDKLGFDKDTDDDLLMFVIRAYVQGYVDYIHENVNEFLDCEVFVKSNGKLVVILRKVESEEVK